MPKYHIIVRSGNYETWAVEASCEADARKIALDPSHTPNVILSDYSARTHILACYEAPSELRPSVRVIGQENGEAVLELEEVRDAGFQVCRTR